MLKDLKDKRLEFGKCHGDLGRLSGRPFLFVKNNC